MSDDGQAALRLDRLALCYPDGYRALHEISFDVRPGEFVVVSGPRGSGRSTLLRAVAGLEKRRR